MNKVKGLRIVVEDGDGEKRLLIMDAPEARWSYPVIKKLIWATFWLFKDNLIFKNQKTRGPSEILEKDNEEILLRLD
jgi:hypothetical protein